MDRNVTVNPQLLFKRTVGPGREGRQEIVRQFFNSTLMKIYGSQASALAKIEQESSDRACRLMYDGEKPVGILVYKKALTNEFFPNSLEVKTLALLDTANSGHGYGSALLNKVEEVAAQLNARSIHVTVNSTVPDSLAFFKKKGFVENRIIRGLGREETTETLLVKQIAKRQFTTEDTSRKRPMSEDEQSTKRKSLETSNKDERTPPTKKVVLNRPDGAKEQVAAPQDSFRLATTHDASASADERTDQRLPASTSPSQGGRTYFAARRVFSNNTNRPPRQLEATLKKIYVDMIKRGTKTIEGRIHSGMFSNLQIGQFIRFFHTGRESGEVVCQITNLNTYNSFKEMLETEGYKPCLPEAPSLERAISTYHSIPSFTERAARSGVVAIHLKKISEK